MTYDKRSFLTGLAVGRQLKGWATQARPVRRDPAAAYTLRALPMPCPAALAAVPAALGMRAAVSDFFEYADSPQLACAVSVPAALGAVFGLAARAEALPLPTRSLTPPAADAGMNGALTVVSAEMEVNE